MSSTVPGIPSDIATIAGPLLLAYLFHWGLFGALSVQLYNYHATFPDDSRISKTIVYGVYLIELAQTFIITRDCFTAYAIGFGDLNALNEILLLWLSGPVLTGIVSCTVQLYYAYRVFVLSKSRVLLGVISTISLLQATSSIAQGVVSFRIGNLHDLAAKSSVTCSIWLAGSAACDVIITISMAYYLLQRDTRVPATHSIVVRLVQLVVETGTVTATAATVDLILYLRFPGVPYHTTITYSLAKLYSNSLLVLFNNRAQLHRGAMAPGFGGTSSTGSRNRAVVMGANVPVLLPKDSVHVHQATFVNSDDIPLENKTGSFASMNDYNA